MTSAHYLALYFRRVFMSHDDAVDDMPPPSPPLIATIASPSAAFSHSAHRLEREDVVTARSPAAEAAWPTLLGARSHDDGIASMRGPIYFNAASNIIAAAAYHYQHHYFFSQRVRARARATNTHDAFYAEDIAMLASLASSGGTVARRLQGDGATLHDTRR